MACAALPGARRMRDLCGIWGQPYLDLREHIDTSSFGALDREISLGLCELSPSYTGGSLKWMGVVAPWVDADPYADLGRVISAFSREEFADFVALAEEPAEFELSRQAD